MPNPIIRYRGLMTAALSSALLAACATQHPITSTANLPAGSAVPIEDYDWHFERNGNEIQLAYGVANSDDIPFGFTCASGSGQIRVNANSMQANLKTITIGTSETRRTYAARQEEAQVFDGFLLEADTTASDPVLASFAKVGWLAIHNEGHWITMAPQPDTKAKTADFIAACS